jgi:murein DD-endopeptidase MepM/ murein hydrolase activator NlpD
VRRSVAFLVLVPMALLLAAVPAHAAGTWPWPVVGPVTRPFDRPANPYGSGHRGIDIAVAFGTPVRSSAPGVVSFAGPVGGELFVTVDVGQGVLVTYSFLSARSVRTGNVVAQGAIVGSSGDGHAGVSPPHLHFGVRVDGEYADPMEFLAPPSVVSLVRLAPLSG